MRSVYGVNTFELFKLQASRMLSMKGNVSVMTLRDLALLLSKAELLQSVFN